MGALIIGFIIFGVTINTSNISTIKQITKRRMTENYKKVI